MSQSQVHVGNALLIQSDVNSELVTIVIVNYNRRDDLRQALLSVQRQDYSRREIIVVDNASQDGSCQMLENEFPEALTIPLLENIGMDGYSVGFQSARGEFIFQMDNDSLMSDTTVLTEVVRRFDEGPPELGVVATRVEEYREGGNIETLRSRDPRRGPINTGGFHSGGVGFRRTLLDHVGYYNRDVFLYGSEIFLQMKFLAKGYHVFFYPEILMLHKSSNVARSSGSLYYELRNRYWFFRCFATPLQQLRFLPPLIVHDLVYSLSKHGLRVLWRALRDGLGKLPSSLATPVVSNQTEFVAKVNQVGHEFGFGQLLKRVMTRLSE